MCGNNVCVMQCNKQPEGKTPLQTLASRDVNRSPNVRITSLYDITLI